MTFTLQLPTSSVSHYVQSFFDRLIAKNPGENEFHQAVKEVVETLVPCLERHPEYISNLILERLTEPDRIFQFRVTWQDDKGAIQVNKGYRVEFNNAIGPYKGGLRFHPSVYLGIIKFLGFEQIFKNALTTTPIGGGKGGSDFDPKGKSDMEVMRFCQSFMSELFRHIGPDTDVPAGDIGVGGREIGYMFGQYKKLTNSFTGVLTGKGIGWGGSLARTEATGYGLVYFVTRMLQDRQKSWKGQRVVVSGSGNVAIYAVQKAQQLGAHVVAISDSNGYIVDESGIKLATMQRIKEVERGRIKEYADEHKSAKYVEGWQGIWDVPCDVALPSATQNEIDAAAAKKLVANKVIAVGEGANMPCTPEAVAIFHDAGVSFGPAKAANAGGVATSALEMAQNSMRINWPFAEVDRRLNEIMNAVYDQCTEAAASCGAKGNLVVGANVAGFMKVARAMMAQGLV